MSFAFFQPPIKKVKKSCRNKYHTNYASFMGVDSNLNAYISMNYRTFLKSIQY